MTYDLTPARPIPHELLRNELLKAKQQAHFEETHRGRISDGTIQRVQEILAVTETQLAIQLARLP